MKCNRCNKPKQQSEMFFNGSDYWRFCAECAVPIRIEKVAMKKAKRAKFIERFNAVMAVV